MSLSLAVADICHSSTAPVKDLSLESLSSEAGIKLLEIMGVNGGEDELRQAVMDFKGHALALTLLGSYLSAVHDGDIRKRDLIPSLFADEKKGGHARRVIESYEKWLAGKPELDILYIMGLFDRPAEGGAMKAVRKGPATTGLTDRLQGLTHEKWQFAVKHLRDLRLLSEKDDKRPETLDCHPLMREHFGEKLKGTNPNTVHLS